VSPRATLAISLAVLAGLGAFAVGARPSPAAAVRGQEAGAQSSARDPERESGAGARAGSGGTSRTVPAEAYFEPGFLRRSAAYNRALVSFGLNARALRWAAYILLLLTPFLPRSSARLARRWPGRENLRVFLLAWVVLLAAYAAVLPVAFASGFLHEHRYGLSRQSPAGWFADFGKGLALWGTILSLLTVLYFLLRRRLPRGGWPVLAVVVVLATLLATFVYPVVVDPLFNRFRPLRNEELQRDLVAMAAEEGVRLERVLVMEASAKTVRENAYFTGLGRTKRVVLWDNLLTNASPAEVRQVFAHELGHWSRGHIVRGVALGAAAIPLACWILWSLHGRLARLPRLGLAGPADPSGIPLLWLLLSALLLVSDPVANAVSRSFEREADRVALDLTRDPETFIESKRRSAVVNLAWVDPPAVWKWLFWTHPTTLERIRTAEEWRVGS
jgi:STE24 endopeptidase